VESVVVWTDEDQKKWDEEELDGEFIMFMNKDVEIDGYFSLAQMELIVKRMKWEIQKNVPIQTG
jgi:hypothetical protein